MLDSLALAVGRKVAIHATKAWLGHRASVAERNAELTDLLRIHFPDKFRQRRLERQLSEIGDQVAHRLTPLLREFPSLPPNERQAALDAVVDALDDADLTDELLLRADMDADKLARAVRARVPSARAGLSESGEALYNLVLSETCVCLVNVVKQLPAFEPRALTEMLDRFSTVVEKIEAILERLPRTSLDAPRGTEHDAEYTQKYLRFISENLDELQLFGVDVGRHTPRISVTVAYLSLSVTSNSSPDDDGPSRTCTLRVEHALAQGSRILLRGQAGSGKTTLLQWIAVNAARGRFIGPLAGWNGHIPFLVRLRSYPDGRFPQPQDLVAANAAPIAGVAPEGWAHRQFTSGKALLLVDGVDELPMDGTHKVVTWLAQLLFAFPDTQVIVTSRPGAIESRSLASYQSLFLEPMSPADVAAFCRRWHDAIRESGRVTGTLPCKPTELEDYEAALARQLEGQRHLRALAASPLLCAMLCALNLDRRKQLPLDRMELYKASLEMLLDRRDSDRELPVARQSDLDVGSKMDILQSMAWWLTLNFLVETTLSKATEQVATAVSRMPKVDGSAADILRYLLQRSGVIREPVVGRIDFIHRTFQEYLASKQAADDDHVDFLVQHAHDDHWRETVVMAAGHATPQMRTYMLNALLDRAERNPSLARRLKLVAASCLDTARTVDAEVIARVGAALDDLIPPRRAVEARSLATAGERIIRHLPPTLDGLTTAEAIACVQTAALVGGSKAMSLLAGYAKTPVREVQQLLATAWRFFPAEPYAATVLADAPLLDGQIFVKRVEHVRHLKHLRNLRWTYVHLDSDIQVTELDFLRHARNLSQLEAHLKDGTGVDLGPVAEHPELSAITVHAAGGGHCVNLEALRGLDSLTYLSLPVSADRTDLGFITEIPWIVVLNLRNCESLRDLSPLAELSRLDVLALARCPAITASKPLPVSHLSLSWMSLGDVAPEIARLFPNIDSLTLERCWRVDALTLLADSGVTTLELTHCQLPNLQAVARLKKLRHLVYTGQGEPDLSPLGSLPALETLELQGMREVNLRQLANPPAPLTIQISRAVKVSGRDTLRPHVIVKERH